MGRIDSQPPPPLESGDVRYGYTAEGAAQSLVKGVGAGDSQVSVVSRTGSASRQIAADPRPARIWLWGAGAVPDNGLWEKAL